MTILSTDPAQYESIAPSTPFERFLLGRVKTLEARVGEQAETIKSQAERIKALEVQAPTDIENIEILFRSVNTVRERVEDLENKPDKPGPGTLDQQDQIETYLAKSPKKRASFPELREVLGVTKSRFSQIIRGAGFLILQNAHDRRRRLLQLPAKF